MPAHESVRILDAATMRRVLTRIAHEIRDKNRSLDGLGLVGIRSRGVPLAERLARMLGELSQVRPPVGVLDINLYRDDLSIIADHPVLRKTEIPFDVNGAKIVLVDDVLFTGRTIRAALDGLMDLGRPDWIQLAVLIDRGHREVPIQPDYVGQHVETKRSQQVEVLLQEVDGVRDEALLFEPDRTPVRPSKSKRKGRPRGKKANHR